MKNIMTRVLNIINDYKDKVPCPSNFDDYTLPKKKHFSEFEKNNYSIELFGDKINTTLCNLKVYQDLLVYSFLKNNISKGSKILDVGGGDSRILNKFVSDYECWNIDKLEGVGNGPKEIDHSRYKLVRDYIGNFNEELPNNYFDFVFSISTLEHVPENNETYKNIMDDINRVLKPNGYSLNCLDILLKKNHVWTNPILIYFFDNIDTVNKFIKMDDIHNMEDIWVMSEMCYKNSWQRTTKKNYSEFGKPTSYNILWQKNILK